MKESFKEIGEGLGVWVTNLLLFLGGIALDSLFGTLQVFPIFLIAGLGIAVMRTFRFLSAKKLIWWFLIVVVIKIIASLSS